MQFRRQPPLGSTHGALRNRLGQRSQLTRIFSALVGSQFGGAFIGLFYWAIAARALTPAELGVGAGLVAAVTLLSMFGVLGIGTLLLDRLKFLPMSDRRALISTGLGFAGLGGALAAGLWLAFAALARISGVLGELSLGTAFLFILTTGLAAVCLAFDQAVLGIGASSVQLRRNLLASVIRIVVFSVAVLLDMRTGQAVLASWTIGLAGSLATSPLRRRHLGARARIVARQRWHLVRDQWSLALGHHGLTLAMVSSTLLLSVVVASTMSATQVAYFSQARLLAETVLAVPSFLTIALFATTKTTEDFRNKAPQTLIGGLVLALLSVGGAALFGPLVLSTFGTTYSQASQPILLLLLCAGPFLLVKDHFAVLRRLQGLRVQGAVVMAVWTAAELAGAISGALVGGMTGLLLGWLGISAFCTVLALPVVINAVRRRSAELPTT